jgi:hypothetical protein
VPLFCLTTTILSSKSYTNEGYNISSRNLMKKKNIIKKNCEKIPESYDRYLETLQEIYSNTNIEDTCASHHLKCGWPMTHRVSTNDLPLYVFVIGIEGSGHHLWEGILKGVLDCNWVLHSLTLSISHSFHLFLSLPPLTTVGSRQLEQKES